jgi:hypothetical protein
VLVVVGVGVGVAVGAGCDARVRVGTGVAVDAVSFDVVGVADGVVAPPEALRVRVAATDGSFVGVVLVGVGVADGLFAGVAAGVTAGLEISVRVGAPLDEEEVAPDGTELAVVLVVVVDEGLVVVAAGADVVGDGAGAVGVGAGGCVVAVSEGDALGEAAGSCTGSHDSLLDVVAAFAAVVLAAAARLNPEAAVSRTLPAISVTVAGRACPKRMKSPTCAARHCCGTTYSGWSGFMRDVRLLVAIRTYWTSSTVRNARRCPTRLAAVITPVGEIRPALAGARVNGEDNLGKW